LLAAQAAVEDEYARSIQEFGEKLTERLNILENAIEQWYLGAESELAELAVRIARHILQQEIALPHDTITALAKDALKNVVHASQVRIRLNPIDIPILEEHKSELLALSAHLRSIEIVDDPTILGGCIIDSSAGTIDATVPTRLELVETEIKEAA
jgi:flagellar biosynthesis/type III secretory pathway protein FliH